MLSECWKRAYLIVLFTGWLKPWAMLSCAAMKTDKTVSMRAMDNAGLSVDQQQLQAAFAQFSQASVQLSDVYQALQQQVHRLTQELALANGELQRELTAKEALSQKLSQLLTALPAGVITLNQEDRIEQANPAALQLLGEPLLGVDWQQIEQERLRPAGVAGEWHFSAEAARMRRIYIENSVSDANQERILLIHDISEAHAMREQNRRNQRLAAMGELTAGLAHQLRTPLSTALLYAEHLTNETLSIQTRQQFAVKTQERLHHLEQLIRNMLQFVKGGSISAHAVSLSTLLTELQWMMAPQLQQADVQLTVIDNSHGASLNINQDSLCSVLNSLLENAVQVSAAGGEITLACEVTEDAIILTVSDEGPGIEPAVMERLFDPFFTTRPEGTGLGLAIAHNIVRSLQGEIQVESAPGTGSRFMVHLPGKI